MLGDLLSLRPVAPCLIRSATLHDDTPVPDLPNEYSDLAEAFSKTKATQLLSHRSSDCSIELLPRITPPRGIIFPQSEPEAKVIKECIEEELAKGFI